MKIALLSLVMSACGPAAIHYDYAKEPDPRSREFVIGVSDVLQIRVWKNPDLAADPTVRPDGTVTMPLVGDLVASGKTPTELKKEITTRLASYIKDEAVVTVAVSAVNSYSFTVSGNVERPGVFTARKYVSVLEALQMAGGPNRFAGQELVVLRKSDEAGKPPRKIPIDYKTLSNGERPEANVAILAGDVIFVP